MTEHKKTRKSQGQSEGSPSEERNDAVIFNWNGHAWDAFEVLGIPYGSSVEAIDKAYEKESQRIEEDSKSFVRQAYASIKQSPHWHK